MPLSDADRRAAGAVLAHHAQLASELDHQVTALRDAAQDRADGWLPRRQALLDWLQQELLPHAAAEEAALYPAAARQPGGRLLVDGMLAEHKAITRLVGELGGAGTAVAAAAAARGLAAVFEVHLAKENDLILPLLLDSVIQVSLADLLAGMHELLGAEATGGGCGGDGECGCGGDRGPADAHAEVLTVDTRVDVRALPHSQRHARVLAALDALPVDGAVVLVAPHAPRPLLAEIEARYRGQIDTQWLQEGPDVWQIRLHRQPVTA